MLNKSTSLCQSNLLKKSKTIVDAYTQQEHFIMPIKAKKPTSPSGVPNTRFCFHWRQKHKEGENKGDAHQFKTILQYLSYYNSFHRASIQLYVLL